MTPNPHQLKIARNTLRLSAIGAMIMGGMDHPAAIRYLREAEGWSSDRIHRALLAAGHSESDAIKWFADAAR